jgi:hypothetical protein
MIYVLLDIIIKSMVEVKSYVIWQSNCQYKYGKKKQKKQTNTTLSDSKFH